MIRKLTTLFACLLFSGIANAAFPQLDHSASAEWASSSTPSVSMPATVDATDLLVLCITTDGAPTITALGDGWVALYETANTTVTNACWAKDADGTEDSEAVVITLSVGEQGSYISMAWSGTFDGTPAGSITQGISATGSSTTPDPPSLNPSGWGTEDTAWIAVHGHDSNTTTDAYPSGYTTNQIKVDDPDGGGGSIALATTESASASQDPSTFTLSGTEEWVANTLAIRPAGSGDTSLRRRR